MPTIDTVQNHSLIDRGANGGIAGKYGSDNLTHPDFLVDIRDIDNYKINSIPIIIVGLVTKTTAYDVIIIVNQCE